MFGIRKYFRELFARIADERAYNKQRERDFEEMLAKSLANQAKSGAECVTFSWSQEMLDAFEEMSEASKELAEKQKRNE